MGRESDDEEGEEMDDYNHEMFAHVWKCLHKKPLFWTIKVG